MASSVSTTPTSTHDASFVPDQTGRTVIVTGANSGICLATARALAAAGARVVLAVRDVEKGARAAVQLGADAEVRSLDLADLASVESFADQWRGPIDILVDNAGVSLAHLERTGDGVEMQFATNHLGHFALVNRLLPHVTDRVVTLASQAERSGRLDLDDLGWRTRRYTEYAAYSASKLANLLFSAELQRRLTRSGSPVISVAAHPGFVASNIAGDDAGLVTRLMVRHLAQSPRDGALPVLLAATTDLPGDSFTGPRHFLHMRGGAQLIKRSRRADDVRLAERLWTESERLTGTSFPL